MRSLPCLALVAATAASLLAPRDAGAIPAFARKYRVSCTTCHAPFPRLKPYGNDFAGRGFALEPGAEPARATLDTGDDLLQLPRDFPIAFRFDGFAAGRDRAPALDFEAPWVLKVLAGGQIADKVAYYGYFIVESGEVVGFEDAYVQLSDVLGLPVTVLIGQFQISDPIAKRELRLTRLDYGMLATRVGSSAVNLTYDRGVAVVVDGRALVATATVTNGNGIGPAANGIGDRDGFKNFGLHLAGTVGPVVLGAFGYVGKERGDSGAVNTTVYVGPQVGLSLGEHLQLGALYLERRDSNASFVPGGSPRTRTRGGFAEAVAYPRGTNGRCAVTGLYNRVVSDDAAAEAHSFGLGLSFLYRRNVRLVAEGDRDVRNGSWLGSVGTIAAF